jgi:hypothetical protein
MTFRTINIGSAPNAGDGDKLRISFSDINTNFTLTQAGLDNISTVIGSKVGSDSPALTGTPTAPTAPAGTTTTQIATTAFVAASFVTTLAAAATYAPLASPTFTGTVTVPTPGGGDNSTKAANTAWVNAAMSGFIPSLPAGTLMLGTRNEFSTYVNNLTTLIPYDNTAPTSTEGQEVITATYAASSASNSIDITFEATIAVNVKDYVMATLFIDSGAAAIKTVAIYAFDISSPMPLRLKHRVAATTTTSRIYRVRIGPATSGTTVYLNGDAAGAKFGGTMKTSLDINEVKV